MKFAAVRKLALALPEVTEEPHHTYGSFRVRGKIFVTVPPEQDRVHVFVADEPRDQAIAMYPEFVEKLMWGKKALGVRVLLQGADPAAVKRLVRLAWEHKAPKALLAALHEAGSL
jgi:hypothetical protein